MVLSSISMFGDFIKLHYVVNWIFKKRFCKLGNLRHIWLIDVSVWCCWISLLLLWKNTLHEKCPITEFFLVRVFSHLDWIRRDTPYLPVFSPNAGKYRPEKTPHLDTFHTVIVYWKNDLLIFFLASGVRTDLRENAEHLIYLTHFMPLL